MPSASFTVQARRISAEDLKRRLEAGEPATILDVRNPVAWDSSAVKIRGAVRAELAHLHVDPGWPKDRLTVIY